VSLETYNALTKELRDKLEELKNVKRPEINNPIIDYSDLATLDMLLISAFYTKALHFLKILQKRVKNTL
jgi:hypothetical protein